MHDLDFTIGHWLAMPYVWIPSSEWTKCQRKYIIQTDQQMLELKYFRKCTGLQNLFGYWDGMENITEKDVRIYGLPRCDDVMTVYDKNNFNFGIQNYDSLINTVIVKETDSPLKIPKFNEWYATCVVLQFFAAMEDQVGNIVFPRYRLQQGLFDKIGITAPRAATIYAINADGNSISNYDAVKESLLHSLNKPNVDYVMTFLYLRDSGIIDNRLILCFSKHRKICHVFGLVIDNMDQFLYCVKELSKMLNNEYTFEGVWPSDDEYGTLFDYIKSEVTMSESTWLATAYNIYILKTLICNQHMINVKPDTIIIKNLAKLYSQFGGIAPALKEVMYYDLTFNTKALEGLHKDDIESLKMAVGASGNLRNTTTIPQDTAWEVPISVYRHLCKGDVDKFLGITPSNGTSTSTIVIWLGAAAIVGILMSAFVAYKVNTMEYPNIGDEAFKAWMSRMEKERVGYEWIIDAYKAQKSSGKLVNQTVEQAVAISDSLYSKISSVSHTLTESSGLVTLATNSEMSTALIVPTSKGELAIFPNDDIVIQSATSVAPKTENPNVLMIAPSNKIIQDKIVKMPVKPIPPEVKKGAEVHKVNARVYAKEYLKLEGDVAEKYVQRMKGIMGLTDPFVFVKI